MHLLAGVCIRKLHLSPSPQLCFLCLSAALCVLNTTEQSDDRGHYKTVKAHGSHWNSSDWQLQRRASALLHHHMLVAQF